MKRSLLILIVVLGSIRLSAQAHIETTIKLVGGKVRIAAKAVGGDITGQPSNFIFVLAVPIANASAVPGPLTKLEPATPPGQQHVPLNADVNSGASFNDGEYKYYWYSYLDNSPSVTFVDGVEYDILEFGQFSGPAQSGTVSLVSLANGTSSPTPPEVSDGLWFTYWEVGGVPYTDPSPTAPLFYQSLTSMPPVNGESYLERSSIESALFTLPVSFINFSGYKNGPKNVLQWTTGSEMNSKAFEVQRSSDGTNYTTIGLEYSKAAGGASTTELSYTFEDQSPLSAKKSFYRLRQLDIDNRSTLSNVVIINGEKPKTTEISGVFPNPANDLLNVVVSTPQRNNVTLVVSDMSGKVVSQKIANIETGSNTVPVEISQLPKGNYLIKVIDGQTSTESSVSKFVKQ